MADPFPAGDDQFEDTVVDSVEPQSVGGWAIALGVWSFYVPPATDDRGPIVPTAGMSCRMYGPGIGSPVRGLFLDGRRVFYRTEAEEVEHHDIRVYGADAADWLARWDAGNPVWTIQMGGIGPGYEQAIHVTAAEILRWFLAEKPDGAMWEDGWAETETKAKMAKMEPVVLAVPAVKALGLSGAQWGAAVNIAAQLYRRGPRAVMADESVKDRHILVCRVFPGSAA